MARKAMIVKWKRDPKHSTRAYTRCRRCGRPHSVLKNMEFVVFVLENLLTQVKFQDVRKLVGNRDIW
jgi:hypothetical protein